MTIDINHENIDKLVLETWEKVQKKVEAGDEFGNKHNLSSEKSLCFLFAMTLQKKIGASLVIDFENQCYDDLSGRSKYLDLLFYTNALFKVAIEFKLPKRSKNGNSNQTQTREQVYRDLARLKYLKTEATLSPKACFFLMAVNEDAYLNKGNYTIGKDYITAHNHILRKGNEIEAEGLSLNNIEGHFNWGNIELKGERFKKVGDFAWLSPISIK